MLRPFILAVFALLPLAASASDQLVDERGVLKPDAEIDIRKIPFSIPTDATRSIETFAAQCDILTLGEVHGTQEVPLLALALLTPLSKLGYGVLALEISKDQQEPLIEWATGKTESVPELFSKPWIDGKGNAQLLSLIRIALSQSYDWRLACFDLSKADFQSEIELLKRKAAETKNESQLTSFASSDDSLEFWKKRDAAMATNLASQLKQFTLRTKVLVICGGMHNRIENNAEFPEMKQFWPTFAANLERDNTDIRIGAINIRCHSGGFFNNGKVNKFYGKKIEQAEAHLAIETGYHWELNLPKGTPATFLSPPVDPE